VLLVVPVLAAVIVLVIVLVPVLAAVLVLGRFPVVRLLQGQMRWDAGSKHWLRWIGSGNIEPWGYQRSPVGPPAR
jgi:hypothetical protein